MNSQATPERARDRILSDHDRLRALMRRVATSASEALRDEKRRPSVRDALAELRAELERHLDYEETMLVPLLANADAWGADRLERLAKDHAGQRTLLAALTTDAADRSRSLDVLAQEIEWFVRSLERDMLDEEATFLDAEALGDDVASEQAS